MLQTHRLPNRCLEVREKAGLVGIHAKDKLPVPAFLRNTDKEEVPTKPRDERQAECAQQKSTSRTWAPSAVFPGQMRPGEPNRDVVPKNHAEFELKGRNIGIHGAYDAVGGYAMRDQVDEDVTENFTQRTFDDFKNYYLPRPVSKSVRGNNGAYSSHHGRVESREITHKNTPGRFAGAFQHDLRIVGSAQDEMVQKGQFVTRACGDNREPQVLKETMKRDDGMVFRQREDENPDRPGLRMQYFDNYSTGWETLETHRRKQADIERTIDHSMLTPYNTCPFTQPLGIVPFSGQNSFGLNSECLQSGILN